MNMRNYAVILDVIRDYHNKYRILPSYSTIQKLGLISSKSIVNKIITELIEDKYLDINEDGKIYPLDKLFED